MSSTILWVSTGHPTCQSSLLQQTESSASLVPSLVPTLVSNPRRYLVGKCLQVDSWLAGPGMRWIDTAQTGLIIPGPREQLVLISQAHKQPIKTENLHYTRSPRGSVELQSILLARASSHDKYQAIFKSQLITQQDSWSNCLSVLSHPVLLGWLSRKPLVGRARLWWINILCLKQRKQG